MKILELLSIRRRASNTVATPRGSTHNIYVDATGILRMKKPDGSTVVLVEDSELFRYHKTHVFDAENKVVVNHGFGSNFLSVQTWYTGNGNITVETSEDGNTTTFTVDYGGSHPPTEPEKVSIFIEKFGESDQTIVADGGNIDYVPPIDMDEPGHAIPINQ